MKTFIFILNIFFALSLNAQISPFTDHNWTIEKIVTSNNTTIMADTLPDGSFDIMYINEDFINQGYFYEFSGCEGGFDFNDNNQAFDIFGYSCIITPNHSNIASHFVNIFILQEGGLTVTPNGDVYGPFSYDFTFSGNLVHLDITNQAGSVATFYASNLSQDNFLKQNVVLYPNPVTDKLFIESPNMALEQFTIYDLSGKMVFEQNAMSTDNLYVSHLKSGVYILRIKTPFGVVQRKLVKE